MNSEGKTVVLATYQDTMRAHILLGALESEGIPCMLNNEMTASVAMQGMLGVQILVFEKDLERAQAILAIDKGDNPVEDGKNTDTIDEAELEAEAEACKPEDDIKEYEGKGFMQRLRDWCK